MKRVLVRALMCATLALPVVGSQTVAAATISNTAAGVTLTTPSNPGAGVCGNPTPPSDTVTLTNIQAGQELRGELDFYYINPDQSRTLVASATVPGPVTPPSFLTPPSGNRATIFDLFGPIQTYSILVKYPPDTQWPVTVPAENLHEIHVDIHVSIYNAATQQLLGTLGSGQDWDVTCFPTTPPGPPLGHGMTATIGFWHNKNGQALIDALNGGASSTGLGKYLSSTYPNLYGSSCGAANLTGATNAQVANLFLTFFDQKGQKLNAQILAAALAAYSTNSGLAGGTFASQYGFIVNATGTGAALFNVGSNGAAFGVANGSTLTVNQILQSANAQAVNCQPWGNNATLANLANNVFDGINSQGDII
jgi:hypothetical protein